MDRLELRSKFSSRVEQFRLEKYQLDLCLKPLSALDRAKIIDGYQTLGKDENATVERMTIESQCFIVSRGLVDENGLRIYQEDELQKIAEEIPCDALDLISKRVLAISGLGKDEEDSRKNSPAVLSADSSSVLQ
jgi:hypothetical protein